MVSDVHPERFGRFFIARALLEVGSEASTQNLLEEVKMSQPTLLGCMEEIGNLGVCSFLKGSNEETAYLLLNKDLWFLLPDYHIEQELQITSRFEGPDYGSKWIRSSRGPKRQCW